MSRGKRAFSAGAVVVALAIAFAMVGGAAALTMSNSVAATDERAPAAPTALVVDVDLSVPAVLLSWTASPSDAVRQAPVGTDFTSAGTFVNVNDVAAYNVWRSDGGDYEMVASVSDVEYSDDTVVSGLTYTYQITAADAGGNESDAVESDPVSLGPPPAGGEPEPPAGAEVSKQATLRLGGELDVTDADLLAAFLADLRITLAAMLGISPDRIVFGAVTQGSIIVDFTIAADDTGTEDSPAEAIANLETQVTDNPDVVAETAVSEGVTTTFEAVQAVSSSNVVDLVFGEVAMDAVVTETFTFTNTATEADADLTVNASVEGEGFAVDPASQTIVPGESGTVDVSFDAAAVGNLNAIYEGTLTIRTNDPEDPRTLASLSAEIADGLDLPVLDLSGTALQFGSILVGGTATKTVTITNKGDLDLEATVALTGDATFTIDLMDTTLAGGEAAIVSVVFAPADTGAASGTITITSNAPVDATKVVQLNGNGVSELAGPKRGVNAAGETVLGFLDDDNDVDFDDFFAFADVFGTATGEDDYNIQADFDESGAIDFDDFFIFADNFGEIAESFLN